MNENTNPRREIYYLGALTIEVLNNYNGKIELFELFHRVNKKEEITMNLFLFVLDWLYLTNTIEQKKGVIKLCS
ncbi:MAG: ABC-three component system middle component 6 [Sulfurimonas sp.]